MAAETVAASPAEAPAPPSRPPLFFPFSLWAMAMLAFHGLNMSLPASALALGLAAALFAWKLRHWLRIRRARFEIGFGTFLTHYYRSFSGGPAMPMFPRDELAVVLWDHFPEGNSGEADLDLLMRAEECWAKRHGEAYGDAQAPIALHAR